MIVSPSQTIEDDVLSKLAAADGFNATLAQVASTMGLPPFGQIDWLVTSKNFFLGQLDPEDMQKTGVFCYPMLVLYVLESLNSNTEKFRKFAGDVHCVLEVNMSWSQRGGVHSFESYLNCFESTVIDVINRATNQVWSPGIMYNGQIRGKRGPLRMGGLNFIQKIAFSMLFQVQQG
jgi:hypothetical protein